MLNIIEQSLRILWKNISERFFDILYKNENIFIKESDVNTMFYPNVDFKDLWAEDISDKTKSMEISTAYIVHG